VSNSLTKKNSLPLSLQELKKIRLFPVVPKIFHWIWKLPHFIPPSHFVKKTISKKRNIFFNLSLGRRGPAAASSLIVSWDTFGGSDGVKIVMVGTGCAYQDAWCGKTPEKNPHLVRGSNLLPPECEVARHALGHSTPQGISLTRYFICYKISKVQRI
jgi:hypothetical protein